MINSRFLGGAEGESAWTAVMILTYMFALMGIQSSPAFTMWTFGIKSPKPLAWQQAFMSTFVVGFALFFFTAFQGMGAKILQMAGHAAFQDVNNATVVPTLMKEFLPPFMLGVVFMGAIAAIHSTAAPYIGTGGSILLRDVYWRYISKQEASHAEQIWMNRVFATLLTILALAVGLTSKAALVILGALATAFGFVMYVLLLGVIWGFKFPSIGAVLGVLAGMIAVFLTFSLAKPALHALRLLGHLHRPGRRLYLQRPRHEGQRRDHQTPGGGQELPRRHRCTQRIGQAVARHHEDRRAGLVLLCHRPGLYPGQQRLLLRRVPAAVVLADHLVDSGYRHDVGPVLQG